MLYSLHMKYSLTTKSDSKKVVSTLTSKGQITLPMVVRQHLGVGQSDQISFIIEASGEVKVTGVKYPSISSLRGIAGSLKKPLSFKEMKKIAYIDRFESHDKRKNT